MKTKKMKFFADKFYNDLNKPLYLAGQIYDVPEDMVARWQKRGGVLVEDIPTLPTKAEEPAPLETPETPEVPADEQGLGDLEDAPPQEHVEHANKKDNDLRGKPTKPSHGRNRYSR